MFLADQTVADRYSPRLNPENALVCAFFISIVLAVLQSLLAAFTGLLFGLLILPFFAPDLGIVWKRLIAINIFFVFFWLFVPWSTPGQIIWQWHFIKVTREGINLALLATVKSNAIICVFLALVAPMSIATLGSALHKLKMPDKLTWILLLTFRNIQILGEQWATLKEAAKLRGFQPQANMRTYAVTGSMLAILFSRAMDRAEIMREAMLLRGFSGKLPLLSQRTYGMADILFDLLILLVIMLLLAIEAGYMHV